MKIGVIYKSKYGSTKQYAQWIAQELGADLIENSKIKGSAISGYDVVVYGGGLYAGGISGVDLVVKNPCKSLVIFTVGLADPASTDYEPILNENLPPQVREKTRVFHLRGGIDYKRLGIIDRAMMAILKKMIAGKPKDKLTDEEKGILATYGRRVDFTDRKTIKPLVDYVKSLLL